LVVIHEGDQVRQIAFSARADLSWSTGNRWRDKFGKYLSKVAARGGEQEARIGIATRGKREAAEAARQQARH